MNEWDILPGGLGGVQKDATGRGVRLDGKAKRLGKAVDRAAKACGSANVSRALSGFEGYVTGEQRVAGSRIGGGVTGLGEAGRAYTDADEVMARESQGGLGKIFEGWTSPTGTVPRSGPPEGVFQIPRSGTPTEGGGD